MAEEEEEEAAESASGADTFFEVEVLVIDILSSGVTMGQASNCSFGFGDTEDQMPANLGDLEPEKVEGEVLVEEVLEEEVLVEKQREVLDEFNSCEDIAVVARSSF